MTEVDVPDSVGNGAGALIGRWERFGRRMFRVYRWDDRYMFELKHVQHSGQYVYGDLRVYDGLNLNDPVEAAVAATYTKMGVERERKPILARPRINLTSSRAITEVSKALALLTEAPWELFMEELCILLLDQFEAGGTLSTVGDAEESHVDVDYMFEGLPGRFGFIPDKTLSCIMAHGGSGKTMMADMMSVALITGQPVGPFNPKRRGPVLVADWELTRDIHDSRVSRICAALGINVPKGLLHHYKPLNQPLDRVIDTIIETVMMEGVVWCWVDSIGPAAAGELNSSEVATKAINALKEIPCASTFLAHLSKAQVRSYQGRPGPTPQASPIGSQFFWNGATAIYELKRSEQLAADGGSLYTLSNEKANLGERWQRPLGYKLWFGEKGGPITCTAETITGTSPGGESMPIQQRIADFLKANGRSTPNEIALALALTTKGQKDRVSAICEQMAARGFMEKWGAAEHAEFGLAEQGSAMPAKVKETPQTAFPTAVEDDVPLCFCGQVLVAYGQDGDPLCAEHMGRATG
jgi:hypothetical protein